jgi:hypothetical protein
MIHGKKAHQKSGLRRISWRESSEQGHKDFIRYRQPRRGKTQPWAISLEKPLRQERLDPGS